MKLYVGNMSFDTNEAELTEAFSQFGEVASVTIITDRDTGRPRGFGFVEMRNDQEAREAIAGMDGKDLGGRQLTVNEARAKTDRGGRGGGGRGRW